MTDKQQPEALRREYRATMPPEVLHLWAADALACIASLEAQLEAVGAGGVGPLIASAGFDAADMATAAAQGFRDGVASVAANAREPVYQARYQKGFWQDSSRERYEYLQNPENTCAEDWETRILYTHHQKGQS